MFVRVTGAGYVLEHLHSWGARQGFGHVERHLEAATVRACMRGTDARRRLSPEVELVRIAHAMGNYYFTCATTGDVSKVEYTFGYGRCDDGKVRIFLHHSSVPYSA